MYIVKENVFKGPRIGSWHPTKLCTPCPCFMPYFCSGKKMGVEEA